jgi:hypothetical protein
VAAVPLLGAALHLVFGDAKGRPAATAGEATAQQHGGALGELVREVGLVEPHRLQRPGVVGDLALEDREAPAARRAHPAAAHVHGDRRLLDRELDPVRVRS